MPCGVLSDAVFYVMERYSIIKDKQPREIVLLRGRAASTNAARSATIIPTVTRTRRRTFGSIKPYSIV